MRWVLLSLFYKGESYDLKEKLFLSLEKKKSRFNPKSGLVWQGCDSSRFSSLDSFQLRLLPSPENGSHPHGPSGGWGSSHHIHTPGSRKKEQRRSKWYAAVCLLSFLETALQYIFCYISLASSHSLAIDISNCKGDWETKSVSQRPLSH